MRAYTETCPCQHKYTHIQALKQTYTLARKHTHTHANVSKQGTGFMALQSCVNHSCMPNASTEGEGSGLTAVYASHPIKAGQEITISYIEEEEGSGGKLSYKQRQVNIIIGHCACQLMEEHCRC